MSFFTEVTPSQVLAGRNKKGNDFLRVNWSSYSTSQNNMARYSSIQLWIKRGADYEWATAPAMIVKNAVSGRVKSYEEREKFQTQDRPSTTFRRTTTYKRTDGGTEKLGEAICAVYEAYLHQLEKAMAAGQVDYFSDKVYSQVQIKARSKDGSGYVDILNPVIRIQIPFRQQKDRTMKLECDIYDLRRKISDEEFTRRVTDEDDPTQKDDVQLEHALVDGEPLNLNNIHRFFTGGTLVTGIIDMSSVCMSKQGISLPSKWVLIIARPGSGRKHEGGRRFNSMLDDLLADAESCEIAEDQWVDSDDEGTSTDTPPPPVSTTSTTLEDDGVPEEENVTDETSLSADLKDAE